MYQGKLLMDDNQQEILNDITWEFPYLNTGIYLSDTRRAPWHWHPAIEIVYIVSGTAVYHLPQVDVILPQGGILFINSEVFHAADAFEPGTTVEYRCQLVSPTLLANGSGSIVQRKYVDPVIQCTDLPYWVLLPGEDDHEQALALLTDAIRAAETKPFLYEYSVQNDIAEFWALLAGMTRGVWQNSAPSNDQRNDRIKQMLAFIQNHCGEKLTLDDIAASAGISTRECLRCFQNTLHITPFEYLIDCRVRRAADRLINSSDSMLDIALDCGFSSSSYFCRTFKKITGQSPSQYRKSSEISQKSS